MAKDSFEIVNLQEVIGDFRTYDKKTQQRIEDVMMDGAQQIRQNQVDKLRAKVVKWTGNLASSVFIEKRGKSWITGPNEKRAVYALWIEYGGKGGFTGYKYVRDSIKGIKPKLDAAINKAIQP